MEPVGSLLETNRKSKDHHYIKERDSEDSERICSEEYSKNKEDFRCCKDTEAE